MLMADEIFFSISPVNFFIFASRFMKKPPRIQFVFCFLLAGLVVFNSLNFRPRYDSQEKATVVSKSEKTSFTLACDFSIVEKDGESRSGQKNSNAQLFTYLLEEFTFTRCGDVNSYFAYHTPDFLKDTAVVPLYLRCRSLLI